MSKGWYRCFFPENDTKLNRCTVNTVGQAHAIIAL